MTEKGVVGVTVEPAGTRIVVLESFPRPRPTTNPYLVQLARSLPECVEVHTFSWRLALAGRYDVFHVHWPENLVRGGSRLGAVCRLVLTALLVGRLALRRTPVVRTLHNVAPHERVATSGRVLMHALDRLTTVWIRLVPWTPTPRPGTTVTIPHGHYRDWYSAPDGVDPVPGRLLFVGLLRPYKGVEDLLEAFAGVSDSGLSLRVAGSPADPALADRVRAAAEAHPRITVRLAYLDDDALAEEVARAEMVVLPYRSLHSSGAALLALSLDRPVIVPDGPTAAGLADEVGHAWVHRFDGPLGPDDLESAVRTWRSAEDRSGPRLEGRDWVASGRAHADAFALALTARRARGGRRSRR